jgi:hypothetical protein
VSNKHKTTSSWAWQELGRAACHGDLRKFAYLKRCSAYRARAAAGHEALDDLAKTAPA